MTKDFTFSGNADVAILDVGIVYMNIKSDMFENTNSNFAVVTFIVTDGYQKVSPVDAVIITEPQANVLVYNGSEQQLISEGVADGGVFYYALSKDSTAEPESRNYSSKIPSAKDAGEYYIWYKVKGDENHNDKGATSISVVILSDGNVVLEGTVYQYDGETPMSNVSVTLSNEDKTVGAAVTDEAGKYKLVVPAGSYNLVAEYEDMVQNDSVMLVADGDRDIVMPDSKTESVLNVDADGGDFNVSVDGLKQEAYYIRESENVSSDKSVVVTMTIEEKTEGTADSGAIIRSFAKEKALEFFDIKIEKTVDSVTNTLDTTKNVMEIAVAFSKARNQNVTVYSYHGSSVRTFRESDSKEDGTFSVDKGAGVVYIYSNRFSTYAIGYNPCYRVDASLSFGSYNGPVTATLQGNGETFNLENVSMGSIVFENVPEGNYTLTITWEDVLPNTLSMSMTVGGSDAKSKSTEKKVDAGDDFAVLPEEDNATVNLSESNVVNYYSGISSVIDGYETENVVYDETTVSLYTETKKLRETNVLPRKRDVFLI